MIRVLYLGLSGHVFSQTAASGLIQSHGPAGFISSDPPRSAWSRERSRRGGAGRPSGSFRRRGGGEISGAPWVFFAGFGQRVREELGSGDVRVKLAAFFLLFLEAMGGSGSFERRRLQVKLLCFIPDFGIVRPRSPA